MQIKGPLPKDVDAAVRDNEDREVKDWTKFVQNWLSAGPYQLRSGMSMEINMDKRLDTVLKALHKEDKDRKSGSHR